MRLLALINPDSKPLGRTAFAVVAIGGASRRPDARRFGWPEPVVAPDGQGFPRVREFRMIWVTRYLLRPSFSAISSGLSPCWL
jgi:hypothetical protein